MLVGSKRAALSRQQQQQQREKSVKASCVLNRSGPWSDTSDQSRGEEIGQDGGREVGNRLSQGGGGGVECTV